MCGRVWGGGGRAQGGRVGWWVGGLGLGTEAPAALNHSQHVGDHRGLRADGPDHGLQEKQVLGCEELFEQLLVQARGSPDVGHASLDHHAVRELVQIPRRPQADCRDVFLCFFVFPLVSLIHYSPACIGGVLSVRVSGGGGQPRSEPP